jgi:phosphoglycerate dehydrogenase-like enzyme
MKQILIDVPLCQVVMDQLQATAGVHLVLADPISEQARALPPHILHDTNILFCSQPPTNFNELTALEWIQLCSSGFEQLLGLNLPERNVRATNAQGVFDVPIAEWCVAMMINLARDLRGMIRNQERGIWDRDARFQREIRGLTVGFWGYGGLARQTARLCKTSLGLRIHVLTHQGVKSRHNSYCVPGTGDPEGALPDAVFAMDKKKEFLSQLDFLILAVPLNSATRGMVGELELKALPAKAFLLNPARGPLVQEQALLRALEEGWIAGAALDTHFQYPMPPEHPLWRFPNVLMTPHISGSSRSPFFLPRVWDLFGQNVDRFLRGEPLLNEIARCQLTA